MADSVSNPATGAPANPGGAPPVAGNGQAAAPAAAAPTAKSSAPKFGGLRGGRKRKDGLVPGSPEAVEADRVADAQRKRDQRSALRQADPPPIPAASGPAETPAGDLGTVPGAQGPAPVPWDPSMLAPLFLQLIPTAEKLTVKQITDRCTKAHLPGEIIEDIKKDAAWNPVAKKAIEVSAPAVAAKWLNKSGVSSEHQHEVILVTAVSSILAGHVMVLRRLDKLVKKTNPPGPVKPANENPPLDVGATKNASVPIPSP